MKFLINLIKEFRWYLVIKCLIAIITGSLTISSLSILVFSACCTNLSDMRPPTQMKQWIEIYRSYTTNNTRNINVWLNATNQTNSPDNNMARKSPIETGEDSEIWICYYGNVMRKDDDWWVESVRTGRISKENLDRLKTNKVDSKHTHSCFEMINGTIKDNPLQSGEDSEIWICSYENLDNLKNLKLKINNCFDFTNNREVSAKDLKLLKKAGFILIDNE